MLCHRHGEHLETWATQAKSSPVSELRGFAQGLRKDWAAVTAGLTLPYSSGAVEGHVNRIILWNLICSASASCSPTDPVTTIGPEPIPHGHGHRVPAVGRRPLRAGRSVFAGCDPAGPTARAAVGGVLALTAGWSSYVAVESGWGSRHALGSAGAGAFKTTAAAAAGAFAQAHALRPADWGGFPVPAACCS
jgi:hypothetical protein